VVFLLLYVLRVASVSANVLWCSQGDTVIGPSYLRFTTRTRLVLGNNASEYGLGSDLLQEGNPIAYASW